MKIEHMKVKIALLSILAIPMVGMAAEKNKSDIDRGRYIVATSGCNDCHTPGYPQKDGHIPVGEWLTGNSVGFQGPWGTSYPANLRLVTQTMTEKQWLDRINNPLRPPMPWISLRDMKQADQLAVFYFIRSLGAKGENAPPYAPPGVAVKTPYIEFFPKNLPTQTSALR